MAVDVRESLGYSAEEVVIYILGTNVHVFFGESSEQDEDSLKAGWVHSF